MRTRGQSETLGFVLVFSLVLLTVGTMYVGGFGAIEDSREDAQVRNMERAFDVLADNAEDVHRSGAPRRGTEIKLGEGTIAVTDTASIRLSAVDAGNASWNDSFAISHQPIVYRAEDGTDIVYSSGAVIRSNGDRAVMLSKPEWLRTENQTTVPLVETVATEASPSFPGPGTVLVKMVRRSAPGAYETFAPRDADEARVNVTVTSPYVDAWKRYFESEGMTSIDSSTADGTVTYQFNTSRLAVVETSVAVTIQG